MLKVFQGFVMNLQEVMKSRLCPETSNCFFQPIPVIFVNSICDLDTCTTNHDKPKVTRLYINPLLKVMKAQVNAVISLISQERKEPQESSKTPSPIPYFLSPLLSLYSTKDL